MDNEELKKKFPFLKNVDLEDPHQKKRLAAILGLVAMGILVIVLGMMSSARKKAAESAPVAVETTSRAQQTGPASHNKSKRTSELLELPNPDNSDEDEILSAPNMISARERQRNSRGANLKNLYGQTEYGDDPMAVPDDKNVKTEGSSGYEDIKKLYRPSSSSAEEEDIDGQSQQQTARTKKKINRGGTPPSAHVSDPPSKVSPPSAGGGYSGPPSRVSTSSANGGYSGPPSSTPSGMADQEASDTAAVTEATPKTVRKSGGISSLDDWGSVDGIGGLDEEEQYVTVDADKPVKVMFVRDQKITSGQRVFLRLLDDIAADGMLIPKNTHLSAQCTIGERMQIKVNNIEINGKIINLGYTAFDNDGNEGLHCPETASKQQVQQGTNTALNIGQSLLQSRVTGIAGQVISSGTSIIRSSTGKVTAQVNAGYTFFLLKDDF